MPSNVFMEYCWDSRMFTKIRYLFIMFQNILLCEWWSQDNAEERSYDQIHWLNTTDWCLKLFELTEDWASMLGYITFVLWQLPIRQQGSQTGLILLVYWSRTCSVYNMPRHCILAGANCITSFSAMQNPYLGRIRWRK